jgi:hypothetical protein
MKRAIVIGMLLLTGVGAAHADYYETTYRDNIRPHGKPRSDAIYQANLNVCYAQSREDRTQPDTPAFKQCMLAHGYSYFSMRDVKTTPAQPAYAGPSVTFGGGNSSDDDGAAAGEAALAASQANDAALAASQAATQEELNENALTVQGINPP